jgi:hypothetical protein
MRWVQTAVTEMVDATILPVSRRDSIGTRGNLTRSQRVRLFLNVVVAHETMIAAALK